MKIVIVGWGRHGKDTATDMLCELCNFTSETSSSVANDLFIFSKLKGKYDYLTKEECFEDRHNHRQEWFDLICAFNQDDPSRLAKEIFRRHDIYCGLRSRREFYAMKNQDLMDVTIWIDRSNELPPEPNNSMDIEPWMADYWIDNNGTKEELRRNLGHLMATLNNIPF